MLSRRTWAGVLSLALLLVLGTVATVLPVPYVTFAPGPTVNVLGKYDGQQIIEVSGRKMYVDEGGLRLVTVIPSGPDTKVYLPALIKSWLDPDVSVYPYDAVYAPTDTSQTVRDQSSAEMTSSQDLAVAAALGALGVDYTTEVTIAAVEEGGPAEGKLEVGDVVTSVDGTPVDDFEGLTGTLRPLPVGSTVRLGVDRKGRDRVVRLQTVASTQDPTQSAIRVQIGQDFEFPFEVYLNIDKNIGGPSGGLMFALGIYDTLTPGSLTDGKVIAGTGEIDPEGNVGVIGGIQQKLVGAQADGARLFLVPAGNCAEALGGNYDPDRMRLVKVNALDDAIEDVKTWVEDPEAELPRCTR